MMKLECPWKMIKYLKLKVEVDCVFPELCQLFQKADCACNTGSKYRKIRSYVRSFKRRTVHATQVLNTADPRVMSTLVNKRQTVFATH